MVTKKMHSLMLLVIIAMLATACGLMQASIDAPAAETDDVSQAPSSPTPAPVDDLQATPTVAGEAGGSTHQRHEFTELGISLEVPVDLYVEKEPLVNLDDSSKLDSYLFYIQNYGFPDGPHSGDFQMYGHLQYNLPTITWEQFAEVQNDSQGMYEYVNPIEIGDLRGFDTQFSGQRNRFVYLFHHEGHVLSIAVADPTPQNKALADEIIASLQVITGGFTDASGVKKIVEPTDLYQLLIPEDWNYTFNPVAGIRLSELEVNSPDVNVMVEESEGPHANIYYKNGVSMVFTVVEDETPLGEPFPDLITQRRTVYFNGIEGTDYIFKEPSTAEGELRQVHISHNGKNYVLRFGYADDTYRDAIERIIANLTLPAID